MHLLAALIIDVPYLLGSLLLFTAGCVWRSPRTALIGALSAMWAAGLIVVAVLP